MSNVYNSHFKTICPCCRGAGYTVTYVNVPVVLTIKRVDGQMIDHHSHDHLERQQISCYHCRGTGFEL